MKPLQSISHFLERPRSQAVSNALVVLMLSVVSILLGSLLVAQMAGTSNIASRAEVVGFGYLALECSSMLAPQQSYPAVSVLGYVEPGSSLVLRVSGEFSGRSVVEQAEVVVT